MSKRALIVAAGVVLTSVLLVRGAHAQTLTVGTFAPSAPFTGTSQRLELTTRLASHLASALGRTAVPRVFARGSDFSSAVKSGDVQVALVDPVFLSGAGGGFTVIAVATHGGSSSREWQLVTRTSANDVLGLRGAKVLVPSVGGRESAFALNAMFGGELPKGLFSSIESAPDTASALAALGLGKADVAIVPEGLSLPGGVHRVLSLPSVTGPVLVTYGAITPEDRAKLASAATSFSGDGVVSGFSSASGDAVRSISRRMSVEARRGPMVLPQSRLLVGDLVGTRVFAILARPLTVYTQLPSLPK